MQDSFKLVKKKRQRKRKININNFKLKTERGSEDFFDEKLKKALEEFESSQFCLELLEIIKNCLTSIGVDIVSEVLCYGLGNFADSKSSLHQLAALVKLNKIYNTSVVVYDPVFTAFEIRALKKLSFKVLQENEEGKRKITGSHVTLIFLPHCPKQLINNFLWANWSTSLCRCIIIGNSFSKIIQDNTKKVLQESADYVVKISPETGEIYLDNSYHIENIFNDISVHCFTSEHLNADFFRQTIEKEPIYSLYELITNSLSCLNIKNE